MMDGDGDDALQACNPLGLCSGSLPSWCAGLPQEFPSLFSLDVRLSLLKKTAFGMARGVAHVQVFCVCRLVMLLTMRKEIRSRCFESCHGFIPRY